MIKVYSHPRSGTHFLEAFLGLNFYPAKDLEIDEVIWGHWSNRRIREEGNPYGKLFGSHSFPNWRLRCSPRPKIYIYRDGRAVASSIWKTDGFLHPDMRRRSFSEFLRTPIDWKGSPYKQANTGWTIADHWYKHVHAWHSKLFARLLVVRYEELKQHPKRVYKKILRSYFPLQYLNKSVFKQNWSVRTVNKKVGIAPNRATINDWKKVFSKEDEEFFKSRLPDNRFLYCDD